MFFFFCFFVSTRSACSVSCQCTSFHVQLLPSPSVESRQLFGRATPREHMVCLWSCRCLTVLRAPCMNEFPVYRADHVLRTIFLCASVSLRWARDRGCSSSIARRGSAIRFTLPRFFNEYFRRVLEGVLVCKAQNFNCRCRADAKCCNCAIHLCASVCFCVCFDVFPRLSACVLEFL